jgi:acyl dehydratase
MTFWVVKMQYFEDLIVGTRVTSAHYEVTRDEVINFASAYDPQPFHLDDAAAAQTHFGRLSASGWHTAAMTMRMMVDSWQNIPSEQRVASLGSPGIDELRWAKPVYPGDTLIVESELLEMRRSASRRDMGITKSRQIVRNQNDEVVMSMVSNGLVKVRDPDAD